MEQIDSRKQALSTWLKMQPKVQKFEIQAMTGDASFRRYFRVHDAQGSFVAMDAPPEKENCRSFVTLAQVLRGSGLYAPEIIAQDLTHGFLLLTDFGNDRYLDVLTARPLEADRLYQNALSALSIIQSCRHESVPAFTQEFMWQEMRWWQEWFLGRYLHVPIDQWQTSLDHCLQLIIQSAAEQPQVFMHRDFHSANLMVLDHPHVGILDFQDAFMGPVTYDLVSLLRDCYIDWPNAQVQRWALNYWQQLHDLKVVQADQQTFLRWFDWMGIERHLKALFTFSRKHVRDGASHYLHHVPRTLHYLLDVTANYSELQPLQQFLQEVVMPAYEQVQLCAQ